MKPTAISRIRQIRQSLFARFAGVQRPVDQTTDSERKSAAVRQLYRIINNDSNVWVPTQVVADRSNGVFARIRRGVSQRVSALTIRNPFSEESLERTKRAFAFSFIETSLEKRQLLAKLSNTSSELIFTLDDGDVLTGTTTSNNNVSFVLTTGTLTNNTTGLTSLAITSNSVIGNIGDDFLDTIKVIGTSAINSETVTLNNYSTTSYNFIAGSDVGFTTTGNLTLDGLDTTGAYSSNFTGNITTGSSGGTAFIGSSSVNASFEGDTRFQGPLTLTGDTSIQSGSDIDFIYAVDGNYNLTISHPSSSGWTTINSNFGTSIPLNTLVITGGNKSTINGNLSASTLTANSAGSITISGVTTISGTANLVSTGSGVNGNITLNNAGNNFGTITANGTNIRIVESDNITLGRITANGDLTVQASNSSSCVTVTGPLDATAGSGNISVLGRNILVNGNITAGAGDIALYGNGGGNYQTGDFIGIMIGNEAGADVNVNTTAGNIVIDGRGGSNASSTAGTSGVYVNRSRVNAGGNGSLSITGVSGNYGNNAYGFKVYAASSSRGCITTNNGALTIIGTSWGNGSRSIGACFESSDVRIAANGSGNISITGTAANGTDNARGIYVSGACVTTNSSSITMSGNSSGSGLTSKGISLINNAQISATGAGHVTITGTAANGLDNAEGVYVQSSCVTTSLGELTVNGTSCGTGINPVGVSLSFTTNVSATGAGNVIIKGSTPGNITGVGISSLFATSNFYSAGGLITLTANSMNLAGTVNATSAGDVLIQTIGTGLDPVRPATFVLGNITANNLTVTANGSITQSGAATISGVANITNIGIGSGGNITLSNPTNNFGTVTACGTNITINDSNDITIGSITATGYFTLQGDNTTSCITVTGPINATGGSGNVSLTGRNIEVTGNITTAAGDIALYGNGGGSYQAGSFDGVCISGAGVNVNTTGGNIVIDGRGGLNTVNAGVRLDSSYVQAGGSGCVTITGVSGNDSSGNAFGIYAYHPIVTTSSGLLVVNGASCGTGTNSRGVQLEGANISSTVSGSVTIKGKSADGTNAAYGVFVTNQSNITITSGTLTINGTSCGTTGDSKGVYLHGSSIISATGSGDVLVIGFAANGTTAAKGMDLEDSACITTDTGSITVIGTSCGTGSTDMAGVWLQFGANMSSTGGGNVSITGSSPGNLTSGVGIRYYDSQPVVYTNGGQITLTANSMDLVGTVNATTAGNVLIQTLGAGVNLGGAGDSANLGLTSAEIGQITANLLTIGNSTTGNIAITDAMTFGNLTLVTGGRIEETSAGNLNVAGTANFVAVSNVNLSNSTNDFGTVLASGTNITVNELNDITIGAITATGDFTVQGDNGTSCISVTGPINAAGGSGSISLTGRNIIISGNVSTATGNIRLDADSGSQKSGNFTGVVINGPNVNINTSGGDILIDGRGGDTSNGQIGVNIGSAEIYVGGNGTLIIQGNSGNSTGTAQYGVLVNSSNLTTANGLVEIEGRSFGSNTSDYGVYLSSNSTVKASSSGNVNITGTSGNGSSRFERGIYVINSCVTTDSGDLTILGTSCGTGDNDYGVYLNANSIIQSIVSGSINIQGISGVGNAGTERGLVMASLACVTTNNGNITLLGTSRGNGSNTNDQGVYIFTNSNVAAGGVGNVNITGTSGTGSGSSKLGLYVSNSSISVANGTSTLVGTSRGSGTNACGIYTLNSCLTVTGLGNLNLTGTGGNGSGSSKNGVHVQAALLSTANGTIVIDGTSCGTGSSSRGFYTAGASTISAGGTGNVNITGISGNGTGGTEKGVDIQGLSCVTTSGGSISITGISRGRGQNDQGVSINGNSRVATNGIGSISITGNGGNGSGGSESGVILDGASQITTANGSLSISGISCGTGSNDHGFAFSGGSVMTVGGLGGLNISGISGSGSSDKGVCITGYACITTSNGSIDISGISRAAGNSDYGIHLLSSVTLLARGLGNITLNGQSGSGSGSSKTGIELYASCLTTSNGSISISADSLGTGAGSSQRGFVLDGNSRITSGGVGNISINANGGAGSGGQACGVYIFASGISACGSISVQATSSGTGGNDRGLFLTGSSSISAAGSIVVNSISGNGSGGYEQGILLENSSYITSSNGGISIVGTSRGRGNHDFGIAVQSGSRISASGTGNVNVTGYGGQGSGGNESGIVVTDSSSINAPTGMMTILGVSNGTGSGGNDYGIYTFGYAQFRVNGVGDLSITGRGGNGTGGNETGIVLSGSTLATTFSGNVTIQGQSFGNGSNDFGIDISSASIAAGGSGNLNINGTSGTGSGGSEKAFQAYGSCITTNNGTITIQGESRGTRASDYGVYIFSSSCVTAGGIGSVNITGTSGTGSVSAEYGLFIQSSQIRTNNGPISVNGLSRGTGAGTTNRGVRVAANSNIAAGGLGSVNITGTGGNGSGGFQVGVTIDSSNVTTANGSISVTGSSGGTGTDDTGIYLNGIDIKANGTGTINLTGITANTSQIGLDMQSGSVSSNSGLITLTANSMNLSGTVDATNSGNVLIQTFGAGVDLGGADDSANLGLTSSEIGQITANVLIIGNSTNGNIAITSDVSRNGNLTLITGGQIEEIGAGNLTVIGTANFVAAGNVDLSNSTNNFETVTASGANITISDFDAIILGPITAGNLTVSAGGAITQTGLANVTGTGDFSSSSTISLNNASLGALVSNGTTTATGITVTGLSNITGGTFWANASLADLNVTNGSTANLAGGSLSGNVSSAGSLITAIDLANVTVSAGSVTTTAGTTNITSGSGASANVTGGTIVSAANLTNLTVGPAGTANISAGTIGATTNNGALNATGGTFASIQSSNVTSLNGATVTGLSNVTGGTFTANATLGNLTVSGGIANLTGGSADVATVSGGTLLSEANLTSLNVISGTANITGGSISGATTSNDTLYISTQIGSLTVNSGNTTVLSTGNVTGPVSAVGGNLTIDRSGQVQDLTVSGSTTVNNGTILNDVSVTGGSLTLLDGSTQAGNFTVSGTGALTSNATIGGTLDVSAGTATIQANGVVTGTSNVSGTGLISSNGTLAALNVLTGGTANITGGTVGATTSAATLNVTDGTVSSLQVTNGNSNISGGSVTGLANITGGSLVSNRTLGYMTVSGGTVNLTSGSITTNLTQSGGEVTSVANITGFANLTGGNTTINNGGIVGGNTTINGGNLTANASLQDLIVTSGTANLTGGTVANLSQDGGTVVSVANITGFLTQTNGTTTINADGIVGGNTTLTNNAILSSAGSLNGTFTASEHSVMTISGNVTGATLLNNYANLTVTSTGNLGSTLTLTALSVANVSGNVAGATNVTNGSNLYLSGNLASSLTVNGSSRANVSGYVGGATNLTGGSCLTLTGNLAGTLTMNSGTHAYVNAGGRVTGLSTTAGSACLTVNGTTSDTANLARIGAVTVNGGTVTIGTFGNVTGAALVTGSNMYVDGNLLNTLAITGGQATIYSTGTVAGNTTVNGGTLTSNGSLQALNVQSTGSPVSLTGGTVANLTQSGGDLTSEANITGFANLSNGTTDILSDGNIGGTTTVTGSGRLTSNGSLHDLYASSGFSVSINLTGGTVAGGLYQSVGSVTSIANITGVANLTGGTTAINDGGIVGGTTTVSSNGNLTANASLQALVVNAGNANLTGGTATNLTQSGGDVTSVANITGFANLTGGNTTINNGGIVGGTTTVSSTGNLTANASLQALVVNAGNANLTGGTATNLTQSGGTVTSVANITGFANLTGGTTAINIGGIIGGTTTVNNGNLTSAGSLNNGLQLTAGIATFNGGSISRTGDNSAIVVNNGTLTAHNTTINGATGATANTPAVYISGGTVELGNATTAGNNTLTLGNGARYLLFNNATANVSAIGNTWNGVNTATGNLSQLYDTVDRIIDSVDVGSLGLVRIKADNVYVTKDSFYAPLGTTAADVQRGVDIATPGDTVNVEAGDYNVTNNANNGVVSVSKNLTISGDGVVVTSVRAFVLNNGSNITTWGGISATSNVTIHSGAVINNATSTPTLVSLIDSNGSLIFDSGATYQAQLSVVNKNLTITSNTPASNATINTIGSGSANTAISLSGTGNITLTDLTLGGTGSALNATNTGSLTIDRLALNAGLANLTTGVKGAIANTGSFTFNGQTANTNYTFNATGMSTSWFNSQFLSFSPTANVTINSFAGNDNFTIDRIMLTTTINGGAGDDVFSLGTTNPTSSTSSVTLINGEAGNNTLNGPVGRANVFTLTGNGTGNLNTTPQTDFTGIQNISGGTTGDIVVVNRGAIFTSITGGGGIDTIQVDSIAGDTVNMTISGTNTGNITGTGGTSVGVYTGIANLIGTAGNDTFKFIDNASLLTGSLNGGTGTNAINYTGTTKPTFVNLATGQATGVTTTTNTGVATNIQDLFGGSGNDYFSGSSAANVMDGGSGNDTLLGLTGNDILVGNLGADLINGGAGYDILIGGFINFVTAGMPNATLQEGLQTIMTSWITVSTDLLFNSVSNTLNTASSSQYRLVGDTNLPTTWQLQTVFNDQATDTLIDIASASVPNWFFATERVTQYNDIVQAGTTFTVSKKTVSSKTGRTPR